MKLKYATEEAYSLIHKGSIALAEIEHNGIRIDTDYLDRAIEETAGKIADVEKEIRKDEVFKKWKKRHGDKANLASDRQLVEVLKKDFGYRWSDDDLTDKHAPKTDETTLLKIVPDRPVIKSLLKWKELHKLKTTFLEGTKAETVDGFLHPMFPLNTVTSYRGASSRINFQNWPNHDPAQKELIRKGVVPREGNVMAEVDFGTHELKIAACVWGDDNMISYASDPDKDVHRDWAAECYLTDKDDVSKAMRQEAKNKFVFPLLYGDYYIHCAAYLWNGIDLLDIHTKAGNPLKRHLRRNRIRELGSQDPSTSPRPGTFEFHIKECQEKFLSAFPEFARRKEEAWEEYQETCQFDLITGFVCGPGIYKKNKVLNYKVQGPAFHCLLWCIPRIMRELKRRKLRTILIAEIHDCILTDGPRSELQEVLDVCYKIMTEDLPRAWKWIVVPLKVEVDVVDEGKTWADKYPYFRDGGVWKPVPKKAA